MAKPFIEPMLTDPASRAELESLIMRWLTEQGIQEIDVFPVVCNVDGLAQDEFGVPYSLTACERGANWTSRSLDHREMDRRAIAVWLVDRLGKMFGINPAAFS